ncbi:MAG TPA: helix-turn-helix transcriptional regulator [Gemmatimonadaceae bacterium]
MSADPLAPLITRARKRLGLSQQQLAAKVGVSVNTLGDLERGRRPRVALETVYRIMEITGISAVFRTPDGLSAEVGSDHVTEERAARAAVRRATWEGGVVPLHTSEPPAVHGSPESRLRALTEMTRSAYAVAAAGEAVLDRRADTPCKATNKKRALAAARAGDAAGRPRPAPRGTPTERRASGR